MDLDPNSKLRSLPFAHTLDAQHVEQKTNHMAAGRGPPTVAPGLLRYTRLAHTSAYALAHQLTFDLFKVPRGSHQQHGPKVHAIYFDEGTIVK